MRLILAGIIAGTVLLCGHANADQFSDAMEAIERHQYSTAHGLLLPLAEAGNVEAQHHLAIMYHYGEGVDVDFEAAFKWHLKAALKGHAASQLDVGVAYLNGDGVRADNTEAVLWLSRSAEQGNLQAKYNLALAYEEGQGVPKDAAKALELFLSASSEGHPASQYKAARLLELRGDNRDVQTIISLYTTSAILGNASSQLQLGRMYWRGEFVQRSEVSAHLWLNLASGYLAPMFSMDNGAVGFEAKTLLDELSATMDSRTLEEALQLADKCLKEERVANAMEACRVQVPSIHKEAKELPDPVVQALSCSKTFSPEAVLHFLQVNEDIHLEPSSVGDGIPTYLVRGPTKLWGLTAISAQGWDYEGSLFSRGPGTAPPVHLGITVEGTEAEVEAVLRSVGLDVGHYTQGKPFLYVSDASYTDHTGKVQNLDTSTVVCSLR